MPIFMDFDFMAFLKKGFRFFSYLVGQSYFVLKASSSNLERGRGVKVFGLPMFHVTYSAKIILGDDVVLNSVNSGYHLNMHSPVKLMADREGAEIRIGSGTRIHGTCIHAYNRVVIGERCLVAANCQIFDGSGHDLSFENVAKRVETFGSSEPVVIEDFVWIGANCIILPGVRVGKGSVIGAGSVVARDVPPMSLVAGNPAQLIRKFGD